MAKFAATPKGYLYGLFVKLVKIGDYHVAGHSENRSRSSLGNLYWSGFLLVNAAKAPLAKLQKSLAVSGL